MALRSLALLSAAALGAAQHHGFGPDFGKCTCETFCDKSCNIESTGAANMTLYRMTPFGVVDMDNKNTGDILGDTSFVVSRRTTAYQCRQNPQSFMCTGGGMAQFQGDVPNNTDLVLEWQIEVDGNWGPYLYCNPVNNKDQKGPWACLTQLSHGFGPGGGRPPPPPDYPLQCSAGYTGSSNYCWTGTAPDSSSQTDTLGDCCHVAQQASARSWTYLANKTCQLYHFAWRGEACTGGVSGSMKMPPPPPGPPAPAPCSCARINETVGLRNMSAMGGVGRRQLQHGGGGYMREFGIWFSHPAMGECKGGHYVGDGSGCTWRAVAIKKAINASCLYGHIDKHIEASNPSCFTACPAAPTGADPKMTDCYLKCYNDAASAMSHANISAPWPKAFATEDLSQGGCPVVKKIQ